MKRSDSFIREYCEGAAPNATGSSAKTAEAFVIMACDETYVMPMTTALRSLADTNRARWPIQACILTRNLTEQAKQMVEASLPEGAVSFQWSDVDIKRFEGYGTGSHISAMTYARLLIPWVIPHSVTRALYLDCDLLVLNELTSLWDCDLKGAVIGAVADWMLTRDGARYVSGVPQVERYFNAGVLLIDVTRWRDERVSERALAYLEENPNSPFSDQDALNVACDKRWEPLDPRWNFQNHLNHIIADAGPQQRPGIVHFVSCEKPWGTGRPSLNMKLYDSFREKTLFRRSSTERLQNIPQTLWFHCRVGLRKAKALAARVTHHG